MIRYELWLIVRGKDNWRTIQNGISENSIEGDLRLTDISINGVCYGRFISSSKDTLKRVISILPKGTEYDSLTIDPSSKGKVIVHDADSDIYDSHFVTK